jgi:hypothetical protein
MKALYHLSTNTLEQLPEMEKPRRPNPFTDSIDVISLQKYKADVAEYDRMMAEYTRAVASLRTDIPCDPSCRGIWTDEQAVEEGKDFQISKGSLYAPEDIIAVPLQPVEDDLWWELILEIDSLPRYAPPCDFEDAKKRLRVAMNNLKSKWILTKKQ